jgi:hypothetical protein
VVLLQVDHVDEPPGFGRQPVEALPGRGDDELRDVYDRESLLEVVELRGECGDERAPDLPVRRVR